MSQINNKTYQDYLGSINSLDSAMIETQKNNYLQSFNPPKLAQLNTWNIYDAATEQDYDARNKNYIGFWDKVSGVAATENLTGRLIMGGYVLNKFEQQEAEPLVIDGVSTTDYDIDAYMNSGKIDYFNNQIGGQEVLQNYYAGEYDTMTSKQFTNAIARDLQIGEIRVDAMATTGSGVADFAASAVGSIIDPLTFIGGGAVFKGGKMAIGAARAQRMAQAFGKFKTPTLLLAETAGQSATRLGSLEYIDSAQREFGDELVADIAYGFMFDGARVLLGKGIQKAFTRLPPKDAEKIVNTLNAIDDANKAKIDTIETNAIPDATIDTVQEIKTISTASKIDWDAPENQGIETLEEFYRRLDEGSIKMLPEADATTTTIPQVDEGINVATNAPDLSDVKIGDVGDYSPDVRKGFIYNVYESLVLKPVNNVFGYALRWETTDNPFTRGLFTVYSKGVAGINAVGSNLGRLKAFIPFEDTQRFFAEKSNLYYLQEYMPIIKQFANKNAFWRTALNKVTNNKVDSGAQLAALQKVHDAFELVRVAQVADEMAQFQTTKLTSEAGVEVTFISRKTNEAKVKEILTVEYRDLFTSAKEVDEFYDLIKKNSAISKPQEKYGWFLYQGRVAGDVERRLFTRFTSAQLYNDFTADELNEIFSIVYNVDKANYGGFKALLKSGTGPDTFNVFEQKMKAFAKDAKGMNSYMQMFRNYFNNKHAGYIDVESYFKIRDFIQQNNPRQTRISLDASKNLMNTSRFLAKLEAASGIINRVKEFAVLENRKFNITENRFTRLLQRYEDIKQDLARYAIQDPEASAFPEINNRLNKWIEDFIDESTAFNKDVIIPDLKKRDGTSYSQKEISAFNSEADLLRSYLRRKFGIDRTPQASNLTEISLGTAHSMLLQGSGINFLLEASKALSNSLAMGQYNQIGALYKFIKNSAMRIVRNNTIGAKKINSQILDSLITLQETNAGLLLRMTSELEDVDGLSYEKTSFMDKVKGLTEAWRGGIQRLSLAQLSSQIIKHYSFVQEFSAHTSKGGLIDLTFKIVNKIEGGMTTRQAVDSVIQSEGLLKIGMKADNLFYNYNQMSKYFTFDEIKSLKLLLDRMRERSNKTFNFDEFSQFVDKKVMDKFKVKANNSHAAANYLINPDELTVDQMAELLEFGSEDLLSGKMRGFFGDKDIDTLRSSFAKFGRYINSQIDDRNLNQPSSVSDFTGTGTHTFAFRAMTMFFRSATSTLFNNTYGIQNRGTATKLYFTTMFVGASVAIGAIKNAMSGNEEKLSTPQELFSYALSVGDYAGLLPSIVTNPVSNLISPSKGLISIPVSDVATGVLTGGKATAKIVNGEPLTSREKRWVRKLFTANFADTTAVRSSALGLSDLIGENDDFNKVKELIDYVYDRK